MGYGARALQALSSYYSGEIMNVDETVPEADYETFEQAAAVSKVGLVTFLIGVIHLTRLIELVPAARRHHPPLCYLAASPPPATLSSPPRRTGLSRCFIRPDTKSHPVLETRWLRTLLYPSNGERVDRGVHMCHAQASCRGKWL